MALRLSNTGLLLGFLTGLIGLSGPTAAAQPESADRADRTLSGRLSLAQVIEHAVARSPELRAARHEVEARKADRLQARLPDNPALGVEAENISARGSLAEEDREITVRLSQTFDLGRISRARVAARESERAWLELEALEKALRMRARRKFISVLAAQEQLHLARELMGISGRAHALAAAQVTAGKAPPTDSLQTFIALSNARADSGSAADDLALARRDLAAFLGLSRPAFESVEGNLETVRPVPTWEDYAGRIPHSADWKRIGYGVEVGEAEVGAAKGARIPPVTLEAGIRQVPEEDGRSWVAGLSLPIPLWNWNQGGIRAARARKAKAEAESEARRLDLAESLAALHREASVAHRESMMLRDQVLPAAKATQEGLQEAYRLGKFGSLEALEAQRVLFEARVRYLGALKKHHLAMAALEELFPVGPPGSRDAAPDNPSP
jgi:cobalt-zinc-cadmium efflux system outer membrane protein